MTGIIDADTHIIEHPGVWEGFDPSMYARRPVLASVGAADARGERNFVWMIDGSAVPKRTGRGSVALAVGGSDAENTPMLIELAITLHRQAASVPILSGRPGSRTVPHPT